MTGDKNDIKGRIQALIPPWFSDSSPYVSAMLAGLAAAWVNLYALYAYAKQQTRVKTATDGWLDMISADYFGTALPRKSGEADAPFRSRILANLLREKGTRYAIYRALLDLTGRAPVITEPQRPADTGGYSLGGAGYGVAGGYGSLLCQYQAFVIAYRPAGSSLPNIAGYGISTGAYGVASRLKYSSITEMQGSVQDADIYAAVEAAKPVGTEIWIAISN